MKTLIKYIRIGLVSLICVAGCQSIGNIETNDTNDVVSSQTNSTLGAGFNQKHYIWINWSNTTNKTEATIR